jgi:hypothetical protein
MSICILAKGEFRNVYLFSDMLYNCVFTIKAEETYPNRCYTPVRNSDFETLAASWNSRVLQSISVDVIIINSTYF